MSLQSEIFKILINERNHEKEHLTKAMFDALPDEEKEKHLEGLRDAIKKHGVNGNDDEEDEMDEDEDEMDEDDDEDEMDEDDDGNFIRGNFIDESEAEEEDYNLFGPFENEPDVDPPFPTMKDEMKAEHLEDLKKLGVEPLNLRKYVEPKIDLLIDDENENENEDEMNNGDENEDEMNNGDENEDEMNNGDENENKKKPLIKFNGKKEKIKMNPTVKESLALKLLRNKTKLNEQGIGSDTTEHEPHGEPNETYHPDKHEKLLSAFKKAAEGRDTVLMMKTKPTSDERVGQEALHTETLVQVRRRDVERYKQDGYVEIK